MRLLQEQSPHSEGGEAASTRLRSTRWRLFVGSEHPEYMGHVAAAYLKAWIWKREESRSRAGGGLGSELRERWGEYIVPKQKGSPE